MAHWPHKGLAVKLKFLSLSLFTHVNPFHKYMFVVNSLPWYLAVKHKPLKRTRNSCALFYQSVKIVKILIKILVKNHEFSLILQSHYTRAQANSPRPIMNSSGPNQKGSQGALASQQHSLSQQSQQPASQSHHSPGGNGREQREQRSSRSSRRKGSDSSVPEEDKDRREDTTGRGEDCRRHTRL